MKAKTLLMIAGICGTLIFSSSALALQSDPESEVSTMQADTTRRGGPRHGGKGRPDGQMPKDSLRRGGKGARPDGQMPKDSLRRGGKDMPMDSVRRGQRPPKDSLRNGRHNGKFTKSGKQNSKKSK